MKKKSLKRRLFPIGAMLACASLSLGLTSCGATTYRVQSEFFWSADAGQTYGNRTKEFKVGENVYMQLIIKIASNKSDQETVGTTLVIPYVQDVVSKYMDGQIITPEFDDLNHTTTYKFSILCYDNAPETNFVFRFIPTKATDITLTLEFDDKIEPINDKQNTITFIEGEQ